MQMTPIITINDPDGGNIVGIITDHTFAGGDTNLRAECVTKKGVQTYESLGWLNGQNILLDVPKSVTIEKVEYRESGYDAESSGEFSCDNEFYMEFWEKGPAHALHQYAATPFSTAPTASAPNGGATLSC